MLCAPSQDEFSPFTVCWGGCRVWIPGAGGERLGQGQVVKDRDSGRWWKTDRGVQLAPVAHTGSAEIGTFLLWSRCSPSCHLFLWFCLWYGQGFSFSFSFCMFTLQWEFLLAGQIAGSCVIGFCLLSLQSLVCCLMHSCVICTSSPNPHCPSCCDWVTSDILCTMALRSFYQFTTAKQTSLLRLILCAASMIARCFWFHRNPFYV